jgi:hypothetical protein
MPKAGSKRARKFGAKFSSDVVKARYDATRDLAIEQQNARQPELANNASRAAKILDASGVPTWQRGAYQRYQERFFKKASRFTGLAFQNSILPLLAQGLAEYLDGAILLDLSRLVGYTGGLPGGPAPPPPPVPRGIIMLPSFVDITPGINGAWAEVDLSGLIPSDATGAIIQFHGTYNDSNRIGLRMKGSTDVMRGYLRGLDHQYFMVGVDKNLKVELWIDNPLVKALLHGHTGDAYHFFENAMNISATSDGIWQERSIGSYLPSDATGVILMERCPDGWQVNLKAREKGSTDDEIGAMAVSGGLRANVCGVDENGKIEIYAAYAGVGFHFITGYARYPMVFLKDWDDRTPVPTGVWTDISIPEGPDSVIFRCIQPLNSWAGYANVRKKGSTDDISSYIRVNSQAALMLFGEAPVEGYNNEVLWKLRAWS